MSRLITLPLFKDHRGTLGVIEGSAIPFEIKRVYFLCESNGEKRGGHRHKKTVQAMVCTQGSCEVFCDNGKEKKTYILNSPETCLIIEPEDWHTYQPLHKNAVIMVLASEQYDVNDYIDEGY
jgi:dTDP-4-dehydrorhamnose 3,5-epimerase-like enzyme